MQAGVGVWLGGVDGQGLEGCFCTQGQIIRQKLKSSGDYQKGPADRTYSSMAVGRDGRRKQSAGGPPKPRFYFSLRFSFSISFG